MTGLTAIENDPYASPISLILTNIGRSIIIQGNIKMGVNRLNPVQKATYF